MKRTLFRALVVLVAFWRALVPVVSADTGCGAIPVDEFGIPRWDELSMAPQGEFTEWLMGPFPVPGLGAYGVGLSFDVLRDAAGHHWYTPTFFTAMYMAFTGWRPDFPEAPRYALLNPIELAAALAGHYAGLGITAEQASAALGRQVHALADLSADDWTAVFRYLGAGADFWLDLNRYLLTSGESYGVGLMALVYCGDPEGGLPSDPPAPRLTPLPTARPRPAPLTPIPTVVASNPAACPPATLQQHEPALVIQTFPPYPVIVGQDPERTGLTLTLRLTTFPVIRTWWEEIVTSKSWCRWDGRGGHGGCPRGDYNGTDAPDGQWHAYMHGAPDWYATQIRESHCEQRVEVIPDPVDLGTLDVSARLRPASRDWILGELARRYPGTELLHPEWDITAYSDWPGRLMGDGRFVVETSVSVPFEDPGLYDFRAAGRTSGTRYTVPMAFDFRDELVVYLLDTALIR